MGAAGAGSAAAAGACAVAGAGFGWVAAAGGAGAAAAASPSMRISTDPTAIICPISPPRSTTRPATDEGISTDALSVITSHRIWSSATRSPGSTRHSTSSTSAMPSPRSGMRMECRVIGQPCALRAPG
jgi:hypothetical protein